MNLKFALVGYAHKVLSRHDKGLHRYKGIHQAEFSKESGYLDTLSSHKTLGRNAVIGMATNYNKEKMAPFILSLRNNGYKDDIILIVSKMDDETRQFYEENNVTLYYYWDAHFIPMERQMARYFSFYRVLRELAEFGKIYDHVLMTDTRDVLFQGDPFVGCPKEDIVTFYEEENVTIGDCYYNSIWIRYCYGDKVLQSVKHLPISNVGTVMGTGVGIMRYLLILQQEALRTAPASHHKLSVDQAAHNLLLAPNGIKPHANGDHIWTLGYVPEDRVTITPDNKVLPPNGTFCPVLHQYDRHPRLVELAQRLYGQTA